MKPLKGLQGYCDSVSCLHTLEHFGLGRYGDPIVQDGFDCGFSNMADLLKNGGFFYLSVPIGAPRVEFNAHRIFDPRTILDLAKKKSLNLTSLTVIKSGGLIESIVISDSKLDELAEQRYALGIFTFIRH
jgi:SAM-dependent methyltransferase